MIQVLNFIHEYYEYGIIMAGGAIFYYALANSNERKRYIGLKILGLVLIVVGCVIRSVSNL